MADEPNRARNIERPRGRRRELQPTGRSRKVSMPPGGAAADQMPMEPKMKRKMKPMPPGGRRRKAGA